MAVLATPLVVPLPVVARADTGGTTPPLQRATHRHFETRLPRREISRERGKRIRADRFAVLTAWFTLSIAAEIEMTVPPAT